VSSTRWSTASSLGALVAGSAAHLALRRWAGRRGDNPLLVPDGNLAARDAYLAAVRASGVRGLRPNG
jgi:hypothetical protein